MSIVDRIAVFDESGTGSTPGDREHPHEFACCGLMVDATQLEPLRRLHAELARATTNSDFKFSDVRKSPDAARVFVQGLASSQCDIIAMYGAPGSVAAEQDRAEALFEKQFGPPPDGHQEPRRTHHENLMQFVKLVATTFIVRPRERHRIYWDARSDKAAIETTWTTSIEQVRSFGLIAPDREIAQLVVGPPNDLKFLARLAGVVAGDIVSFFRNCGERLFQLARPNFVVPRHPRQVVGHLKVADGKGKLIRPGVDDSGPQRTLLRGYYWRLLNRQIFFYHPDGRGCGVKILKNPYCSETAPAIA